MRLLLLQHPRASLHRPSGAARRGSVAVDRSQRQRGHPRGLVALGSARYLKRLLDQSLEDAARCSSDPLCAEHIPEDPSDTLHAAACHACLFASETSCETNNRWLDRAFLVDITGDGLAFLS